MVMKGSILCIDLFETIARITHTTTYMGSSRMPDDLKKHHLKFQLKQLSTKKYIASTALKCLTNMCLVLWSLCFGRKLKIFLIRKLLKPNWNLTERFCWHFQHALFGLLICYKFLSKFPSCGIRIQLFHSKAHEICLGLHYCFALKSCFDCTMLFANIDKATAFQARNRFNLNIQNNAIKIIS